MLYWSPQKWISSSQLRSVLSLRPNIFHFLNYISFNRQSCWNELIRSYRAVFLPFMKVVLMLIIYIGWWLQSPPDPQFPCGYELSKTDNFMNGWIAVWAWPNLNRDWENNASNTQDIDLPKWISIKVVGFWLKEKEQSRFMGTCGRWRDVNLNELFTCVPGNSSSWPRWQVGHRASEGTILSFSNVKHTVAPAVGDTPGSPRVQCSVESIIIPKDQWQ